MDKTMVAPEVHSGLENLEKWPALKYYFGGRLVVDRAWVESRQKQLFLEIEGRFFTVPLERVRAGGERDLDEGDLIPVDRTVPLTGAWPLTDGCERFRLCLREEWARAMENLRRQRELLDQYEF